SLQRERSGRSYGWVILHDQDCLRARERGAVGHARRLRGRPLRLRRSGQPDAEGRASTWLAEDADIASGTPRNGVTGGEPDPRALAHRLGGKERFEDVAEHL